MNYPGCLWIGALPHAAGVQPRLVLMHELQVGSGGRIQREAGLR